MMSWVPEDNYQSRAAAVEYDKVRFTSVSGRVFNFLEKRTIAKCFSGLAKGMTVVDIPCGTGRLAENLLRSGYKVHGMDISGAMLEVAKKRLQFAHSQFTCEIADARKATGEHALYGAALCARVLMHFPLPGQIEFLSGVAALSQSVVVINHSLDSSYQRLRRRFKRLLGHQASANFPITNRDIKTLLQASGLRETKRYRLLSPISEAVYIVAEKI